MKPALPEIAALWEARGRRERAMLVVLAVLVAIPAAWYGVASPLRRAAANADADRARAMQQLAMVEGALREFTGAQGFAPLPAGGMEEAATASAAASGIALTRMRSENAREITIWASAVDPGVFFAWAMTLQKAHGIVVANLTATRDEDGALDVEARLAGGGE